MAGRFKRNFGMFGNFVCIGGYFPPTQDWFMVGATVTAAYNTKFTCTFPTNSYNKYVFKYGAAEITEFFKTVATMWYSNLSPIRML